MEGEQFEILNIAKGQNKVDDHPVFNVGVCQVPGNKKLITYVKTKTSLLVSGSPRRLILH